MGWRRSEPAHVFYYHPAPFELCSQQFSRCRRRYQRPKCLPCLGSPRGQQISTPPALPYSAHLPPGWGEPVILPYNSQLALLWNTTVSKIHRPAEMRYGQSVAAHIGPAKSSAQPALRPHLQMPGPPKSAHITLDHQDRLVNAATPESRLTALRWRYAGVAKCLPADIHK